jgi:2-polyprenyl-6-hydroxyphenyl methylase / 3-demethylubiquinone-9 3-methyltransferase
MIAAAGTTGGRCPGDVRVFQTLGPVCVNNRPEACPAAVGRLSVGAGWRARQSGDSSNAPRRKQDEDLRMKAALWTAAREDDPGPGRGETACGGVAVPIDNEIYDRLGQSWWDERSPLNVLHGSMTPGRFAYFREVLTHQYNGRAAGMRALDVGCGGGFLAEEFARLGFDVVGVDPSTVSIEAARRHAAVSSLKIDYRVGAGEQLPLQDCMFDVAYCCDVLEHVSDLDRVMSETARVLKPGGLYLFDTLNRTLQSKLVAIKVTQEWPLTRIVDTPLHDWQMFIKPAELARTLHRHGLHLGEIVGLGPRAKLPTVLRSFISVSKGRITYGEFSRRVDFGRIKSTAASYMGYATKAAATDLRGATPHTSVAALAILRPDASAT